MVRVMKTIVLCFAAMWIPSAAAGAEETLWTIGTPDGTYSELAVPGRWEQFAGRFGTGVVFTVGRDDPGEAWPYIHPGPADFWGGSKPHEFEILFELGEIRHGAYALRLHLMAGHDRFPPRYRVGINARTRDLRIRNGPGDDVLCDPAAGTPETLEVVFGAALLKKGLNRITLRTVAGSWLIYDAVQLAGLDAVPPVTGIRVEPASSYLNHEDGPQRLVLLHVEGAPLFEGGRVKAEGAGISLTHEVHPDPMGTAEVELSLALPEAAGSQAVRFTLEAEGKTFSAETDIPPARKWIIYLLHHTHLDIGYTHTQEEVEKRQMRFLDEAMEHAERTRDYPPEARFKWLPEGLWAVESWMKAATPEKRQRFIDLVKRGQIGLDALYGNALTGLYTEEELIALTRYARKLTADHGVTIDTAMISDVPGYTWGLVPALAHVGVKYFSIGPNAGHRIGYTLSVHGDRPFYWVSPCGRHRVLCWMAGKGYGWFHTGFNVTDPEVLTSKRTPDRIAGYLKELEEKGYPYDMVHLRYNIGGDNGPPDPTLPEFVKAWNERFAYPRFVIATTREMFEAFEARYEDRIPERTGDFTPYWEDGAASTARDTARNRLDKESLAQDETLFAMLDPGGYDEERFWDSWRNHVLYDEHTWGAWNSISDPDNPFVKTQAAYKSKLAWSKFARTKGKGDPLDRYGGDASRGKYVYVFNTLSWPRSGLVAVQSFPGDPGKPWRVKGPGGEAVLAQRVPAFSYSGDVGPEPETLTFLAEDVPAFGAKRYTLEEGEPQVAGSARAEGNRLSTDRISLEIDPESGAIKHLEWKGCPHGLVDRSRHRGLNDYIYVEGRDCNDKRFVRGAVEVRVLLNGPLLASLVVSSDAPGCAGLERWVGVIHELDRVDICDFLFKDKVRTPEGVHLAFPWNIPGGQIRIDTPWAVVRPELDQMIGANKDYFPVQRWVDVSNQEYGVTWATREAPMIEVGAITMDVYGMRRKWRQRIPPTQTFHSYVMNNYWETNYAADQEGIHGFQYAIKHHGPYDPVEAHRFGMAFHRHLVAVCTDEDLPVPAPLLEVEPDGVIVTSLKPSLDRKAFMVRLFNVSEEQQKASLRWGRHEIDAAWISSPHEERGGKTAGPVEMAPMEIVTLRCETGL